MGKTIHGVYSSDGDMRCFLLLELIGRAGKLADMDRACKAEGNARGAYTNEQVERHAKRLGVSL